MTETPIKPIPCPHCGAELSVEVVSAVMDSSRMAIELSPHDGELLSASNVGGALADMHKLLSAVGREIGVKTNVLVEGVSFVDGKVKFNLLVCRHAPGIRRRGSAT